MTDFRCPQCRARYETVALLASHMENDDRLPPGWVSRWVLNLLQETTQTEQQPQAPPASSKLKAETEFHTSYKRLRVWFLVDGGRYHRREIPGNESFQGFCSQLKSLYYECDGMFSIDQFEYALIEKRSRRMLDVEPFVDSASYYRMVTTLLGATSQWRHAIVRKRIVSTGCQRRAVINKLTCSS